MMINSARRRLIFALILVISHIALTAHGMESHNRAEFTQCEYCVAQGGSDCAPAAYSYTVLTTAQHIEFPTLQSPAVFTAEIYPAWSGRAPPIMN